MDPKERTMKLPIIFLLLAILAATTAAAGDSSSDLKPFPPAEQGYQRAVVWLTESANEKDLKVEIIAGRSMVTDCNTTWIGGDLERRVLEGWGYSYFLLEKVSAPATTLMACPPGTEKTEAFVPVKGAGYFLRYNSRLPLVIYAPDDTEIRYRIWSAGTETHRAEVQ